MGRKKSVIPGFSLNRALGITSAKQKIARATGIPTTKQGRKRKMQSHLWTAAAVGIAAACSTPRNTSQADGSGGANGSSCYDGGYNRKPPTPKPFYKKWWFWVLAVILISNLTTKIPEIMREKNQQEAARILAERSQQTQDVPAVEPEEEIEYTEEEQAAAAKEYYEKIGYDPTQEEPVQEVPDDGISYIVPADQDTGGSYSGDSCSAAVDDDPVYTQTYVLNTNTHKFHRPGCSSVGDIKPENYSTYTGTRDSVVAMGYQPCGRCDP